MKNVFKKATHLLEKTFDISGGILMTIILIIAAIVLVFGVILICTSIDIDKIDSCKSPNGEYTLSFEKVGEPFFLDDGNEVRFVLKKGLKTITKYTVTVFQMEFTPDSWDVEWYDDHVRIYIFPENAVNYDENPIFLYFDNRNHEVQQIDLNISPDGKYTVLFEQIGTDIKNGSSYEVRFRLRYTNKSSIDRRAVVVYKSELTPESWQVDWYDNRVEIHIIPECTKVDGEQTPITMYFEEISVSPDGKYAIHFENMGAIDKYSGLYNTYFKLIQKDGFRTESYIVATHKKYLTPEDLVITWNSDHVRIRIIEENIVAEGYENPICFYFPRL